MKSEEQLPMLKSAAEDALYDNSILNSQIDEELRGYRFPRRRGSLISWETLRKSIPAVTLIVSILILLTCTIALRHIDSYLSAARRAQPHRISFALAPTTDTTAHTCHRNDAGHLSCTAAFMEAGVGPHGYDFEAARALKAGSVPGPIYDEGMRKDRAFVTVLTNAPDVDDWYFTAVRLQAYRLRTRHTTKTPYPFIVLLPHDYPAWKTSRLISEGATVKHVDILTSPNKTSVARWSEAYTKLHIFNMTAYDRLIYLDADIIVLQSPEGLMGDPILANCHATFPTRKSTRDSHSSRETGFELAFVRDPKVEAFNAGVMVVRPDGRVFGEMMEILKGRDYDTGYGDQALLNKYFEKAIREKDPKVIELPSCYNTQWAEKSDTEISVDHPQAAILLHRKAWWENDDYFTKMFFRAVGEMEGYWTARLEAE